MRQSWLEVFEQYAAEKTAAAVAAELPPYLTDQCHPDKGMRGIGNEWSIERFDGVFYVRLAENPNRPACSLVFVQSADGNTGAADPESLGGGSVDKHLIYEGLSRVACDAVLAGAHTVRGARVLFSVWHPELVRLRATLGLPRHPVQIVASTIAMNLDESLMFNVPEVGVVLLTLERAARSIEDPLRARPWITVVRMQTPEDLLAAFEQLRLAHIERISCDGGRTLARALLEARLVDDVYLTTAPRAGGEPGTPLHVRPWRGAVIVRKYGTGVETGVVFEHIVANA